MIGYLIFTYLKCSLLAYRQNLLKLGLHFLLLLCFGFYGFLAGKIIESPLDEAGISKETIIHFIFLGLLVIGLFRMIMPSYKPMKQFLSAYLPVSSSESYVASVLLQLISPFYFFSMVFILMAGIFMKEGQLSFLLSGALVILSSHLFRRAIQYGIDFRLQQQGYLFYLLNMALMLGGILAAMAFPEFIELFIYATPLWLFTIGYLLHHNIAESRKSSLDFNLRGFGKSGIYLKMLYLNPTSRLMLLMAVGLKFIFIVGGFWGGMDEEMREFTDNQLFLILLTSSLLLYTNVFNNTWAFAKSLWLNYELRTGDYKEMMKVGLKLQAIPVLLDALVTLPLLYFGLDAMFVMVFYFTAFIFLCSFSFFWAMAFPVHVTNKSFYTKSNGSFISNLVSIGSILLLSLIRYNHWLYLIIIVYLFLSAVIVKLAIDMYKEKKYELYVKLMKRE